MLQLMHVYSIWIGLYATRKRTFLHIVEVELIYTYYGDVGDDISPGALLVVRQDE